MSARTTDHRRWRRALRAAGRLASAAVLFVIVGNVAILGMVAGARLTAASPPEAMRGIHHFRIVDDHLWRGDAPSPEGYRALADAGITTVVDLRSNPDVDPTELARYGLRHVHLPIPDGHAPDDATVDRFLATVDASDGVVYLHCAAGVGRTGALTAAYLTSRGHDALTALHHNLSVGPPSLEQVAYVLDAIGDGRPDQPGLAITLASRLIDGPRLLFTTLRHQ